MNCACLICGHEIPTDAEAEKHFDERHAKTEWQEDELWEEFFRTEKPRSIPQGFCSYGSPGC